MTLFFSDFHWFFFKQQIIDLDEKNQLLKANIWLNYHWYDVNLSWNKVSTLKKSSFLELKIYCFIYRVNIITLRKLDFHPAKSGLQTYYCSIPPRKNSIVRILPMSAWKTPGSVSSSHQGSFCQLAK